ncbi:MAG: hypothetical protein BGN92_13125 [Sphingobacteriales bacterium 41-5]|nr:MAG: hypothetical protein BGN92_13125 [Sphingobacteriales bacterium 41-5]
MMRLHSNYTVHVFIVYLFSIILSSCSGSKQSGRNSWIPLFNGTSTQYWRSVNSDDFPKSGWRIDNNILVLDSGRKGGDIITSEKFGAFELELEYNISKYANTGVKYYVDLIQRPNAKKMTGIGFEYQIIDDHDYPLEKTHKDTKVQTGALYELYGPAANKILHPPGSWNSIKIIAKKNKVEHWLNGKMVVQFQRGSDDLKQRIQKSKFAEFPGFGMSPEGYILIQDYGNMTQFRNIRIKKYD